MPSKVYLFSDFVDDNKAKLQEEFPDATEKQINKVLQLAWEMGHATGDQDCYLDDLKEILER